MHPSPEDDGQEEKPGLGPSRPIVRPCGQVPCIAFVFNPRFFRGPLAIVRVLPALFCAAGALPFPVVVHEVVNEPPRLAPRHRRGSFARKCRFDYCLTGFFV